jgi:hypothetical protein
MLGLYRIMVLVIHEECIDIGGHRGGLEAARRCGRGDNSDGPGLVDHAPSVLHHLFVVHVEQGPAKV